MARPGRLPIWRTKAPQRRARPLRPCMRRSAMGSAWRRGAARRTPLHPASHRGRRYAGPPGSSGWMSWSCSWPPRGGDPSGTRTTRWRSRWAAGLGWAACRGRGWAGGRCCTRLLGRPQTATAHAGGCCLWAQGAPLEVLVARGVSGLGLLLAIRGASSGQRCQARGALPRASSVPGKVSERCLGHRVLSPTPCCHPPPFAAACSWPTGLRTSRRACAMPSTRPTGRRG